MNAHTQNQFVSKGMMASFDRGDLIALGFGVTVAMWAIGYVCRLPPVIVPTPVLVFLLLACLFSGGLIGGLTTPYGGRTGLYAGSIASTLNLLVLGSLITGTGSPNQIVPSALWWIPGSYLLAAGLGYAGASLSTRIFSKPDWNVNWTGTLAWIAVLATFFLLIVGGMVTSYEAGLTVVDWPNSFGYNMFLYPLSRMSGGIYYEHAHRLFGSLAGLSVLTLAVLLHRTETRGWLRGLSKLCLALVIVQGILGGLRVTGRFTLSTSLDDVAPSITLAIVHGVFGQIVFATLVSIALFTSTAWINAPAPIQTPTANADRIVTRIIPVLVIAQLVVGAILRHIAGGLHLHITLAVVVAAAIITSGVRAWGLYPHIAPLKKLGLTILVLICLQLCLGLGALAATGITQAKDAAPNAVEVVITTAHQATGAVILAVSVLLMLWVNRLLAPTPPEEAIT